MPELSQALERERNAIIAACERSLIDWGTAHGRDVAKDLEAVGKHFYVESGRYRPRLSIYNWFKKTYKVAHREAAVLQIADTPDGPEKKGLDLAQVMNSVANEHWSKLKGNPDDFAALQTEYELADAYIHDRNTPPRSPTKCKLKTLAQSRRSGRNYIRKALEGIARYAEDNSFDVACYFADRTLSDYGGVLPEQIGTTAGVIFIATIAQKGFSGEFLQILAQSSHSNLAVEPEVNPQIYTPQDPISEAFPSLVANRRPNGAQDFISRSRHTLNSSIRALIKSHANRIIKDKALLLSDRSNIPGSAEKLEEDLRKRGVQLCFKAGCNLNYSDLANYRANASKLSEVYAAIVLNQIVFEPIAIAAVQSRAEQQGA